MAATDPASQRCRLEKYKRRHYWQIEETQWWREIHPSQPIRVYIFSQTPQSLIFTKASLYTLLTFDIHVDAK